MEGYEREGVRLRKSGVSVFQGVITEKERKKIINGYLQCHSSRLQRQKRAEL